MYESFFGFSGPPFQLNPDPSFYFDSRGHANALAYLKFGVYQGEGFIVVTGDIGAGKTTLVRTLLEGLDPHRVVAAQVVSTRLESVDLLRAILTAFGVPPKGESKAQLIAAIEAFLTTLAASDRRALLIVDEAQNLNLDAIEELRMLSNFQFGTHALLQSFLVGQPELRGIIESRSLEQLRQRIIASCHLGPLDVAETRAYVEHRLRHVGWMDRPAIEPAAFEQLHRWTGGIPRRINLLCNRVLLASFIGGDETITAAQVEQTARDLRGEVGEGLPPSVPEPQPEVRAEVRPAPPQAPPQAPAQPEPVPAAAAEPVAAEPVAVAPVAEPPIEDVSPVVPAAAAQPLAAEPVLLEEVIGEPVAAEGVTAGPDRAEPVWIEPAAEEPAAAEAADAETDVRDPDPADAAAAAPACEEPAALACEEPAAPAGVALPPAAAVPASPVAAERAVVRHVHRPLSQQMAPLLCVADTPTAWLKVGVLARVFADEPDLPGVVALNPGREEGVGADEALRRLLPGSSMDLHLGVASQGFMQGANTLQQRFAEVLDELKPGAVLLIGQSDAVLACSLAASRRGLPLVRLEAGQRHGAADSAAEGNAVMMDRLANQLYTSELTAHYTLCREGIASSRVHWVGSLLEEALHTVLPGLPQPHEAQEAQAAHSAGLVLVTLQFEPDDPARSGLTAFVEALSELGSGRGPDPRLDLRWLADARTQAALAASGLEPALRQAGVRLLPPPGHLARLGLLRQARCLVVAPQGDLIEEARMLEVPRVVVCPPGTVPVPAEDGPGVAVACEAAPLAQALRDLLSRPRPARDPACLRRDSGAAKRVALHLLRALPRLAASRAERRGASRAADLPPAYSALLRTPGALEEQAAGAQRDADPISSSTNG